MVSCVDDCIPDSDVLVKDSVAFIVAPRSRGGTPSPLGRHGPIYRSQHQTVTAASPMSPKVTLGTKRGPRDTHTYTHAALIYGNPKRVRCNALDSSASKVHHRRVGFVSKQRPRLHLITSSPLPLLGQIRVGMTFGRSRSRNYQLSMCRLVLVPYMQGHADVVSTPYYCICSKYTDSSLPVSLSVSLIPSISPVCQLGPNLPGRPCARRQGRRGPTVRALPVTNRLRKRKSLDVLPSSPAPC